MHPAYLLRTPTDKRQSLGGFEIAREDDVRVSSVSKKWSLTRSDPAMHELDVPVIVAIEPHRLSSLERRIFRDCLRVGYVCRVADVGGEMAGYGIMSVGAGEAQLNVCIRDDSLPRLSPADFVYLLDEHGPPACAKPFSKSGRPIRPRPASIIRWASSKSVRRGYYQALVGREDARFCAATPAAGLKIAARKS